MKKKVVRMRQLATRKGQPGMLPVSPATIWRWTRDKTFPTSFKLGPGVTCWDAAEVDEFIAVRYGDQHD